MNNIEELLKQGGSNRNYIEPLHVLVKERMIKPLPIKTEREMENNTIDNLHEIQRLPFKISIISSAFNQSEDDGVVMRLLKSFKSCKCTICYEMSFRLFALREYVIKEVGWVDNGILLYNDIIMKMEFMMCNISLHFEMCKEDVERLAILRKKFDYILPILYPEMTIYPSNRKRKKFMSKELHFYLQLTSTTVIGEDPPVPLILAIDYNKFIKVKPLERDFVKKKNEHEEEEEENEDVTTTSFQRLNEMLIEQNCSFILEEIKRSIHRSLSKFLFRFYKGEEEKEVLKIASMKDYHFGELHKELRDFLVTELDVITKDFFELDKKRDFYNSLNEINESLFHHESLTLNLTTFRQFKMILEYYGKFDGLRKIESLYYKENLPLTKLVLLGDKDVICNCSPMIMLKNHQSIPSIIKLKLYTTAYGYPHVDHLPKQSFQCRYACKTCNKEIL